MPLGNAHHKHIVTIEGINPPTGGLNPVQQAMADAGATQCGFCTPGFVMSLAGFCLSNKEATQQSAIAAIDGNICRCTGYKSIERAAETISEIMKERKDEDAAQFVAKKKILPGYFALVKEKLSSLITKTDGELYAEKEIIQLVGGGTDLYVQKHDELKDAAIRFMFDQPGLNNISKEENKCIVGPSATVSDLKESPIFNKAFPEFHRYAKLVSSTPIRNMATIGGNFVNASPIGDFTIFFLALDAQIVLSNGKAKRELPLRKLYKGYKQLDKTADEYIQKIWFELPEENTFFNFEKVSKRTHLDIASVNTAIFISMNGKNIVDAGISAGGVGPIPMYLQKTAEFLKGKPVSEELVHEAIEIAQSEISPISDARGAKEYKRLLLSQLIKAHFITLFPELRTEILVSP
jgi:xanthine dehydrogenase small subunit